MKCTILKEDFKKGLNVVSKITSKSVTLPVLENILISVEKNFLRLTSTNLEIGIKYWILSKTEKEGSVLVSAKTLNSLTGFLKTQKLNLINKGKDLVIEEEGFKTRIKGLDPNDFPIIPKIETDKFLEIESDSLSKGLSQVIENVSFTQTRPEISGVFFSFEKEKLKLVGTDSFRLGEKKIPFKNPFEENYSFILPQKTARELINILSGRKKPVKIHLSPNQVMFESEMEELKHPSFQIISRLIEGEFPNYEQIIPEEFKTEIIINRDEFLNEIKKVSLFSSRINEVKLKISPKKKEIEVLAENPEVGEGKSSLKGKIEGEEISVSFNYKFLIEGLEEMTTPEVIFKISGEEKPALIKPLGDESFLYIVMPLRTS